MTLTEKAAAIAAAGAPTPPPSAQKKTGGIIIRAKAASDKSFRSLPGREENPSLPTPCKEEDRLLGTENRTDTIPNFPHRSGESEKLWQTACLSPQSQLGIILSHCSKTGWIALNRPGQPPLLLSPLPLLGRLSEMPLDPPLPV